MPQLPATTLVTPWDTFIAMSGVASTALSSWVWSSMKPGATARPEASSVSSARQAVRSPIAAMRSPSTAMSPLRAGAPVPSIRRAPRISRWQRAMAAIYSRLSSSSMKPAMTFRPLDQKSGSVASRPKGASSSLWRLVPPALSISMYFSAKPASAF